jgi:hypothetical protein
VPVATSATPDGGTRYVNDKYSVSIGPAGEIAVRQGDWLSKYSAAIHDHFWAVNEYARAAPNGDLAPVQDPNLIIAGETLYHIPTWNEANGGGTPDFKPLTIISLSEDEKARITSEAMEQELDLPGDTGAVGSAVKWIGRIAGPAAGVAKLVEVAGLFTASAGGTLVMGVTGPIAMCVGYMFSIVSSMSFGMKLFALKGSAYVTTAWAFGDDPPRPPPVEIARVMTAHANNPGWWRDKYVNAWNDVRKETLENLQKLLNEQGVSKEVLQIALRASGDDDPRILASRLYAATRERVSSVGPERTQHQLYAKGVDYPH